jgi:hypothetical protein
MRRSGRAQSRAPLNANVRHLQSISLTHACKLHLDAPRSRDNASHTACDKVSADNYDERAQREKNELHTRGAE